jgi:hypothetical protein
VKDHTGRPAAPAATAGPADLEREKENHAMSKNLRPLALCLLAAAGLAAFAARPAHATPDFLSYSQPGGGGTMADACAAATQAIADHCDGFGPITTDPGGCKKLYDLNGNVIGKVCTCTATTTYCLVHRPLNLP